MDKNIVNIIVGDSISYGLYDDELFGWVNRLRLKDNKMLTSFYFNLSVPGQSSSDVIKRFASETKNRYNKHDVFNIIFAVGIKDALKLADNSNHIFRFQDNIKKIIEISKQMTNNIYFVGLLDVNLSLRPEYDSKDIETINDKLQEICKDNNVLFIDMKGIINIDDCVDGLHPNANGHQKICDVIYKEIYSDEENEI